MLDGDDSVVLVLEDNVRVKVDDLHERIQHILSDESWELCSLHCDGICHENSETPDRRHTCFDDARQKN